MARPLIRDMDLIRVLLIEIEAGGYSFDLGVPWSPSEESGFKIPDDGISSGAILYHLRLIDNAGYIDKAIWGLNFVIVERLSWSGHDFLDSIRDENIWNKTKAGALAAGGWTAGLLGDLAKGYVKKQIEQKTGIGI